MDYIAKNAINILKVGVSLILANLAQETVRQSSKSTMENIAKDLRKAKSDWEDKRKAA